MGPRIKKNVKVAANVEVALGVAQALREGKPVVALESTLIAHGLPWPLNLDTAREAEAAIRAEGVVPATIAVWEGHPTIGLYDRQLEALARRQDVSKASRRDLAGAIAMGDTAATTVAATTYLAHRAGIRFFATGGIGGAHAGAERAWDISADLVELARTPVAVVCAGAKSILDIPRTLEILETLGVPVIGYQTSTFPAFYLPTTTEPVGTRVESVEQAATLVQAHWELEGGGLILCQPVAADVALEQGELETALAAATEQAATQGIKGKALTPFMLARLASLTHGKTLRANHALVIANARLAAQVARTWAQME